MPIPLPLIGAGIAAVGQILGNIFNASSQNKSNEANFDFQREMYARQRADSLADWQRTNEYNSPEAQMRRLKQAGLNPNLVYGDGNAIVKTGQPEGATPNRNAENRPVRIDTSQIGDVVNQYFNVQRFTKELEIMEAEKRLKDAQALDLTDKHGSNYWNEFAMEKMQKWNKAGIEINQMNQLFPYVLDAKKELANQIRQSIRTSKSVEDLNVGRNAREKQFQVYKINMAISAMLTQKQQREQSQEMIRKLQADINYTNTKEFNEYLESRLRSQGGSFSDKSLFGMPFRIGATINDKRAEYIEEGDKVMSKIIPGFHRMTEEQKNQAISKFLNF